VLTPNRVWLFASSVLCALVLVWPRPAIAQDQQRVLHMSAFAPDALIELAQANGSLAAAGLDVQTAITPSSTEQMQGLSDGTYDIASTAFDNVLAWSGRAGATIVAIAQTDSGAVLPIVVRPEINDWSDLRGKPVAVDAADTAFAVVLRRVLRAHGLELNTDYTFVPFGAPAARLAALQDGRAYAAILNPPFDAQGEAAGLKSFGDHKEVLPDYPGGVLAVRADWAEANRQDLEKFLLTWIQAGGFAAAHPDDAAAILAQATGTPAQAARMSLPVAFNGGAIQDAGLMTVLDLRNEFGYQLPMGPQLGVYIDTSYYQDAAVSDD
jgi:ABC-type nitrate/sulfonate/bicarbonate transport system substrate-binding protein